MLKLAESSDVFLTSYLPAARTKLGLDVDDIRAANPNIIYARGSGWGDKGPMRNTGGYDLACGWATSGFAQRLLDSIADDAPPSQPPAFYDLQGGNTLAGAISTALFQRERPGHACDRRRVADERRHVVDEPRPGRRPVPGQADAARTASTPATRSPTGTGRPTTGGSTSCCCRPIASGASCAR